MAFNREASVTGKARQTSTLSRKNHLHPATACVIVISSTLFHNAMRWKEHYALGHAPMDATHQEFVRLVRLLAETEAATRGGENRIAAVAAAMETLLRHSQHHFAQEDFWMAKSGFPPSQCHADEHQRVLTSLQSILRMVENGHAALGKSVARELESWFEQHAATMDTALARHMRHVGYAPSALPEAQGV
jgi:hemerythrin-like metal-binding protein